MTDTIREYKNLNIEVLKFRNEVIFLKSDIKDFKGEMNKITTFLGNFIDNNNDDNNFF